MNPGTLLSIIMLFLGVAYAMLLLLLRKFLANGGQQGSSNDCPLVSVLIPAHNEEGHLPRLFDALESQEYSREKLEIILIDDRSTDATSALMTAFAKKRKEVTVIRIQPAGHTPSPKKNALEKGVETARGEIILTTDADCQPGPRWIKKMVAEYTPDVGTVLGYAPYEIPVPSGSLFHKALALDYLAMGTISAATVLGGHPVTSFGANFSYRKKEFLRVGGFGRNRKFISGDDDLLLHRLASHGAGKIAFCLDKDAAVFNPPPGTFKDFIRQRLRFASKHLAYPVKLMPGLLLIYAFNTLLSAGILSLLFSSMLLPALLLSLLLKSGVDILLLTKGQQILESRPLLKYYPLTAVPHIFYVSLIPILARFSPERW